MRQDYKIAVVTGASAGIGEATARILAENGFAVAVGARRTDRIETLAEELSRLGAPRVFTGSLDVRDAASTQSFSTAVLKRFSGHIDVLVNNAGLALSTDSVQDGDPDEWQTMIDTNVMGLARVTKAFLPTMVKNNTGHIVNIGSIAGHFTYGGGALYAGSKHAVKAINGALRLELSGTKVRVSSIDPGMVESEFSLVRLRDQSKAKAVYQGMTPLSPRDVAECVLFAVTRPAHVNLDHILIMPTDQAAIHKVHRET